MGSERPVRLKREKNDTGVKCIMRSFTSSSSAVQCILLGVILRRMRK
jgi:hypothetical protein